MANWNPASFTGRMFQIGGRHAPPPVKLPAPVLWGDEATVRERLAAGFEDVRTELIHIEFDLPFDPPHVVEFFRKYFGPTHVAFSRLDSAGQAAFAAELEALWAAANVSGEPGRTTIKNEYLQVRATKKG